MEIWNICLVERNRAHSNAIKIALKWWWHVKYWEFWVDVLCKTLSKGGTKPVRYQCLLHSSTCLIKRSHIDTFKQRSSGKAKFDRIDLCTQYNGNKHHPSFKQVFFYNLNHIILTVHQYLITWAAFFQK